MISLMLNQKGTIQIILIGIVIIFVIVGVIYWLFAPKESDYVSEGYVTRYPSVPVQPNMPQSSPPPIVVDKGNGLKTYTEPNSQLFSIDFPANWKADLKTSCGGPVFTSTNNAALIICYYLGDSQPKEEFAKFLTTNDTEVSQETITVSGQPAIKTIVKSSQSYDNPYRTYVVLSYKGSSIYLSYADNSTELPYQNEKIFNDMVNSFTLIKN
jgi:hypothetical protein